MRWLGPAAAQHELRVACPDPGVQPDPEQRSAPESERVVGAPVGIAEDVDVVELLAVLVAGQRLVGSERDDHHADSELIAVVKHLDQVLAARQSGEMAQEDHEQILTGERRERDGVTGGVAQRQVG